ncbi:mRNA cap guanine-N7 methyltransferase [Diorhabda sublineata]|uniref:mRNA cap guanine-N7 methyltransferase n=1 Tax=Diorhabda sublineata TaxID=1163346 RepID=UPI0024E1259C|nr:mRNA cap guanine-N7 methyltransferase [Diorhabda sublineata]
MTEINELEQALVIVAADADSRNYQEINNYQTSENDKEVCKEPEFYKNEEMEGESSKSVDKETTPIKTLKRKLEDEEIIKPKLHKGYADVVANHYNKLEEKGIQERLKSRIVYLRNFHNWIKSMLINEYLTKIKDTKKHNAPIRVHDMCCGKGGDLLKWKKGSITHLICSDIADVSLEQCKARYTDMKSRFSRERGPSIYSIEYIAGDSTRMRLREKYSDPSTKVDLVSCQFAFHYSFESLPQAECMLRNAAECLNPGGYFIATIPDANEIVARAKRAQSNTFGNNVYEVSIDFDINKPPLFGAKYNFQLDGVVNCPEFLVHFPTLVKLAKRFGLKLVKAEKFHDYFQRWKDEGRHLLSNMRSLQIYPFTNNSNLVGTDPSDYQHAEEFLKQHRRDDITIGTLSKSEWEVTSLYITMAFEKVKHTWNKDGTPVYNI